MDLVGGAGGFIGGHLVAELRRQGRDVRAVDIKPAAEWFQRHDGVENVEADLRAADACQAACAGVSRVFNLACDMGGIGFITAHKARCLESVLINTHLLIAARDAGVGEYFYSSSACAYNIARQSDPGATALKESDAYPAQPEEGYGWEKLFSERVCAAFAEEYGIAVRVARLHNVYGPHGSWCDGREKAPAALCRKVIEAVDTGADAIEIWGDGRQTRSFMWIGDCVEGILRLMAAELAGPVNLGSSSLISIGELADAAEHIAGVELGRRYRLDAPIGVAGRNSDNTLLREVTAGWEPRTPLSVGLTRTYRWIEREYRVRRA